MALQIAKMVPELTRNWPFYLSDQFKRATSSVVLNIAEGNGRFYPKERRRFFNIATSSAKESASILDITLSFNLTSNKTYELITDMLLQVVKMVSKLP
ncbi:MAG: four helix bundle protein [Deltaproteobacteria bacterium]|nr:four helix bundle protein [Deltaproteobacteria bacterium]